MYGGYYVGLPPDQGSNWTHYYHNGAFYSDPRISAYIGMGLHQMPGNVWWRSWRELPPPAPFADCQSTDPRLLLAGAVADGRFLADLYRSAVRPAVPGVGGALHLSRLRPDLHPHLRGRDVRGADAERGRAGDHLGHAQLRARGRPHRRGADQVRHAAAAPSGVGHVAVEHVR